jgi:pimeloyl-CoA synthetase
MESDANQKSDGAQNAGVADLRTQLRTTLTVEFERALSSAVALTEDQRKALSKLVTDDGVTSQTILKALNAAKKDATNE